LEAPGGLTDATNLDKFLIAKKIMKKLVLNKRNKLLKLSCGDIFRVLQR
jgi:hypothetical protein